MERVFINKQPKCFQNYFSALSRHCLGYVLKMFSHLKYLRRQHVACEQPADQACPTCTTTLLKKGE